LLFGCVQKLCGFGSVIIIKFLLLFFLFFSPATSCKTLSVLREDAAEIFVFSFSLTKQFCALFCSALLYSVVVVVVVFILFSTLPPPHWAPLSLLATEEEEDYDRVITLHAARATAFFFFLSSLKKNLEPFHTTNVSNCVFLSLPAVESSAKRMMETDVVFLFVELGS
jgi:hypothetical protein